MNIDVLILLVFLNGVFALGEIAVISSRKSKLRKEASEGSAGAQRALKLSESPSEFLSTIQIWITLFGILAGTFSGGSLADMISNQLNKIPFISYYSEVLGLGIVVAVITFAYLILGELVPKRLALSNPERYAKLIALPMDVLSRISSPLVWLLSVSTNFILKIFHIKDAREESAVSEEEVRMLIVEGEKAGVFETAEKEIVERSFNLSNKNVSSLMTSRKEIVWLSFDSTGKAIKDKIAQRPFSYFPVYRDNIDKVIGVVRTDSIICDILNEQKIDLKKVLLKPLFIPESIDCLKALELFKTSSVHVGIVVDEYGNVQGLLSLADVMEALVGDMPASHHGEEREIVKRDDGTFFVDGLISIDKFKEQFHFNNISKNDEGGFHTLGGLVTRRIGRIPMTGDSFQIDKFKFEVVDMDGNRVDKVLVSSL